MEVLKITGCDNCPFFSGDPELHTAQCKLASITNYSVPDVVEMNTFKRIGEDEEITEFYARTTIPTSSSPLEEDECPLIHFKNVTVEIDWDKVKMQQ